MPTRTGNGTPTRSASRPTATDGPETTRRPASTLVEADLVSLVHAPLDRSNAGGRLNRAMLPILQAEQVRMRAAPAA